MRDVDGALLEAVARAAPAAGTVSWWVGPVGGPARSEHAADAVHHAASTVKVAVLVAALRHDAGWADLVRVHDDFDSAATGQRFRVLRDEDSDELVWAGLGRDVPFLWLVERMVTTSSNLATDLVLEQVGLPAVRAVLADAGCAASTADRLVDDVPAAREGLASVTTAADLARLLGALVAGDLLGAGPSAEALRLLRSGTRTEDVVAGLPPGTDVAHKNGWDVVADRTVRHSVALVSPTDAEPYLQAVCTTTTLADARACDLVADLTRAAWSVRHAPGG